MGKRKKERKQHPRHEKTWQHLERWKRKILAHTLSYLQSSSTKRPSVKHIPCLQGSTECWKLSLCLLSTSMPVYCMNPRWFFLAEFTHVAQQSTILANPIGCCCNQPTDILVTPPALCALFMQCIVSTRTVFTTDCIVHGRYNMCPKTQMHCS